MLSSQVATASTASTPSNIAFFVSSIGDTDLAKNTIQSLMAQYPQTVVYLIALTKIAEDRIADLAESAQLHKIPLQRLLGEGDYTYHRTLEGMELQKVQQFIGEKQIAHAYIGVSSQIDEEAPYQIATQLTIPCTIAYEYMFKPVQHAFWEYTAKLAKKPNCAIAVSAPAAALDMPKTARVHTVGHLSIDRAMAANTTVDVTKIRDVLQIEEKEELVFVSGTTQPRATDLCFVEALLNELETGAYPHIQLRMGLHPGIVDLDAYLASFAALCRLYPRSQSQFKIMLPESMEQKLKQPLKTDAHMLRVNVSGAEAAQAADKVAQAVPGALLNEAVIAGKPSYFHGSSIQPYLPGDWFSDTVLLFFREKPQAKRTREELQLKEPAPELMAHLLMKPAK